MASMYENFLSQHRSALLVAMREPVIKSTPSLRPDEVESYTERVVDTLIAHCLANTGAPVLAAQAEGRQRGVSPEGGRDRAGFFIRTLEDKCRSDTNLSDSEQKHILRMLDASGRYMQTIAIVLKADKADGAESE